MKIGLPSEGSFQTINGVKFTVLPPYEGQRYMTWDGGVKGGKITQYDTHDVNGDEVKCRFKVRNAKVNQNDRYTTLDRAARESIKNQQAAYEAAKKLVAEFEAA